jgi:hypothetical protein
MHRTLDCSVNNVSPMNIPTVMRLVRLSTKTPQMMSHRHAQSLEHNRIIKKRDKNTERERFHQGKDGQQNKVPRMAMALPP